MFKNPQTKPQFGLQVIRQNGEKIDVVDPRATRALVAIMNFYAVVGGAACHWGGPSALAETMSALHGFMFEDGKDDKQHSPQWSDRFHFVNDAGHTENGVYALRANYGFSDLQIEDLWKFRSIASPLTGHGEVHVNPSHVLISNGPLGSAPAVAQGLCMSDRLANNTRLTFCVVSDGACMEGETKEALAAIPGLAKKGKLNPYVMLISDNNTKLSGRIDEDSFSMTPTFRSLNALGWRVIKVEQGHDLQQVYSAIENAAYFARRFPEQPVCLHIQTVKGKGNKKTEESKSGGHGYPLGGKDGDKLKSFIEEIYSGGNDNAAIPKKILSWVEEASKAVASPVTVPSGITAEKREKIQVGISKGCIQMAKAGHKVVSISADLQGSTGMETFRKEFPQMSFEVGVAEANMVSVAAGFSKTGFIPVVDTFAQFGVTKGLLPLTMANLSQAPIIGVFSHTGFQDAADGASHQATTYLSATMSLPYTVTVVCSCSSQAEAVMKMAIERLQSERESVLFFLGRENFPTHYAEKVVVEWGKPSLVHGEVHEKADLLIVVSGSMLEQGLLAATKLKEKGISAKVVDHLFVNRVDVPFFKQQLDLCGGKLITLEDHQVMAGMGAHLVHQLKIAKVEFSADTLGIPGHFGRSAYNAIDLYRHFHMSWEDVLQRGEKGK